MNTKQLKYVLVLAQEGSFSKAAATLNISQPSLSQYIKKIETDLGVSLFDRLEGSLRLTDAGEIYVEASRQILNVENWMENSIADLRENKCGTVTIGTSPYRSVGMVPTVAAEFKKRYPGICLITHELETALLLEGAARGEFDICLTTLPVDENLFSYEKIMEEELVLAVPAIYREAFSAEPMEGRKYPAIDVSQLNGYPFVMITSTQVMQIAVDELCRTHGLTLQRAAVVKSLEAQLAMVRQGIGLALVPTGIEKINGEKADVVYFSLKQQLLKREVVAMYRKGTKQSRIVRELIDTIKDIKW